MVLAADAWTKRSMAVFDKEVLQPLLRSKPSQLALQNGRASTEHAKAYLIKAEARNRAQQRRLRKSIDDAKMPADLQALKQAQSSDGKWWPSSAVTAALGGQHRIPAAPAGFDSSDWRWTTALVITYMRRRPQYFDACYAAYAKGEQWLIVTEQALLKEAHIRLPPHSDELYYALDAAAVQQGTWLHDTQQLLNRDGYESFTGMKPAAVHNSVIDSESIAAAASDGISNNSISRTNAAANVQQSAIAAAAIAQDDEQYSGLKTELHDAKQRAKCQFSAGEHVECRWRRLAGRLSHATIDSTNWHRAVVTAVRKGGTVDVRFCQPLWPDELERSVAVQHVRKAPETVGELTVHSSNSTAVDAVGNNNSSHKHDASSLRESAHISGTSNAIQSSWTEAITMNRELKRLKQIKQRTAKARPQFITTFDPTVSFSEGATTMDRSSLKSRRHTTDSGILTTQRILAVKATAHTAAASDRNSTVVQSIADSTTSTAATDNTANIQQQQLQQQCADTRAAAEAQAVTAIIAYEDCLTAVKKCLSTSLSAHPAAKTYTAQAAVLEELRVRLGFGHIARTNNSSNSSTTSSNDSVSAWRSQHITGLHTATLAAVEAVALLQELSVKEGSVLRPFFWAGKPFLLSVPQQLNFLRSAHAAPIRMFYGKDFPTLRNPFCMSYGLDTRPCTPRKSRVKSIVNGEICMTVNAALEQQRLREVAAVTAVQIKQCKQIPPWWPCYGLEEKQFVRVRQAEAVLLREEQQFAHWLSDTTASSKASSTS
eukprot:4325-Heterococcus_DN1.PRE.5